MPLRAPFAQSITGSLHPRTRRRATPGRSRLAARHRIGDGSTEEADAADPTWHHRCDRRQAAKPDGSMKIAVLGTGPVGTRLASHWVALGHTVAMGSRTANNASAREWVAAQPDRASHGTFASATRTAEVIVNATSGANSLSALLAAGANNLGHKVLIDVANPLVRDAQGELALAVANGDSLAEQIQRDYPQLRVVKALNTMNVGVMVNPRSLSGSTNVFICGNDAHAKTVATDLIRGFGWAKKDVVDLGDLSAARGLEMYVVLWARLASRLGTPSFNISLIR
jgi:predicted dinucleotide-binding enzyme